jgi:hypothetical protein
MVSTVIDILNARLQLTGFFHTLYCLVEKKKEERDGGDFVFPAQYVGGGDLQMIEFDSAGFAYFRKDGEITQSIVDNDFGQSQWYEVTIPLKLVAMVNRSDVGGDTAFSPDALARQLASSLTFKNGDLRTALTAAKTQVNAANWITDPEQIWSDETEGTGVLEPDYSRAFIAMSVTVTVTADERCIQNLCEADTDILHIFDFCKPATVARLTDVQVDCLLSALPFPCPPATYTLINTAQPPDTLDSGSIPSGGDLPIIAPPATVRLVDTDDNELLQDSIPSGVQTDVTAPDATLKLNNSLTTYPIRSGELYNMLVRLNGQVPQTFSYTPGTKTLDVISPPCADGTVEINGDAVANVPSGGLVNIMVEQDGNPVGAFDPNSNSWVIPPCGAGGSVSLAVSNTNPQVGSTITLTATATGFTPTDYLFFVRQGNNLILIGENSTGVLNWQVNLLGTFTVFVQADDNTVGSFNVGGSSVTSSSSTITAGLQLWLHPALSGIVPPNYPDISGFNRDGTLVNSPTVITGSGGYVEFNGVNQAVENIGGLADFAFIQNTLQFTIGAWVYATDLTGRNPVVANTVTGAEKGFFLICPETVGSSPVGSFTKAIWISITRGVSNNTVNLRSNNNIITTVGWNYITVTMNGLGTGQIYLNGQPITTTQIIQGTAALSTGDSSRTLSVGRVTNSTTFFTGRIAPVQIYDRALTAQEVEDNFDADKFQYGF